ncbi:hypothetical protein BRAO285_1000119 [Bradyrhizobium sp. ORS 285]|nr:hypothetical protein BRAO285_1000119 [Bradyrhizobium sp. ORS 285]
MILSVMPGLVPGIHAVLSAPDDVDGRDKPGHDVVEMDQRKTSIVICNRHRRGRRARPLTSRS